MDATTVLRAVDMGPAAEDPGAADFRAFWGDRAELRRFQARQLWRLPLSWRGRVFRPWYLPPFAPLVGHPRSTSGVLNKRTAFFSQDGAISEAVVWEAGPGGRHLIVDTLVAYALGRHLPSAAVVGTAGALDGALAQQGASPDQLASARRCSPSQLPLTMAPVVSMLREVFVFGHAVTAVPALGALVVTQRRHTPGSAASRYARLAA